MKHELQVFYDELMSSIEEVSHRTSPFEEFLKEYLICMEISNAPIYIEYYRPNLNVQIDAYAYDDEEKTLDLYILDYNEGMESPQEISMTILRDLANKAKRFFANYQSLSVDPSHPVMDLIRLLNDKDIIVEQLNIVVFTNQFYRSNKPIEIQNSKGPEINVQIWDIDRIYQLISADQDSGTIQIDFEKDFGETFDLMFVPDPKQDGIKDNFDCYIGFISADLLAKAYDKWGPKLVERNVRSFLQAKGNTNKGIRETLRSPEEKQMFVVYNNGISSVARAGEIEQVVEGLNIFKVRTLDGWQIVNGGQTTASIHQAYQSGVDLRDVYIQTKLTILQIDETQGNSKIAEEAMVSKISKYANTQNKINQSDLLANTRFMSSLEHFSRTVWIPSQDKRKAENKWFFERARGQYMVDVNRRKKGRDQTEFKKEYPKDLLLDKVDLAKNFMSWEGFPHVSSKGREEAFKKFMDQNKIYWKYEKGDDNKIEELEEMTSNIYKELIARVIINRKVLLVVETMGLKGYKANVVYYSTAMLNLLYGKEINLQDVWDKQSLSEKWDNVIKEIAQRTLEFLRDSAGDQNVTQWAKKEICWKQYKEECQKFLSYIY